MQKFAQKLPKAVQRLIGEFATGIPPRTAKIPEELKLFSQSDKKTIKQWEKLFNRYLFEDTKNIHHLSFLVSSALEDKKMNNNLIDHVEEFISFILTSLPIQKKVIEPFFKIPQFADAIDKLHESIAISLVTCEYAKCEGVLGLFFQCIDIENIFFKLLKVKNDYPQTIQWFCEKGCYNLAINELKKMDNSKKDIIGLLKMPREIGDILLQSDNPLIDKWIINNGTFTMNTRRKFCHFLVLDKMIEWGDEKAVWKCIRILESYYTLDKKRIGECALKYGMYSVWKLFLIGTYEYDNAFLVFTYGINANDAQRYLHYSLRKGSMDIYDVLITMQKLNQIHIKDVLEEAAKEDNWITVRFLIAKGHTQKKEREEGSYYEGPILIDILNQAAIHGSLKVCTKLLDQSVDDIKVYERIYPYFRKEMIQAMKYALEYNHTEIAKMIYARLSKEEICQFDWEYVLEKSEEKQASWIYGLPKIEEILLKQPIKTHEFQSNSLQLRLVHECRRDFKKSIQMLCVTLKDSKLPCEK
jgi:hypothetical protein